jgi:hypothetical protein
VPKRPRYRIRQPQINDRKIGAVFFPLPDRLVHSAGDAAYFVSCLLQNFFQAVGDHEVVFDDENFKHYQHLG